jgi:hypothetical protein
MDPTAQGDDFPVHPFGGVGPALESLDLRERAERHEDRRVVFAVQRSLFGQHFLEEAPRFRVVSYLGPQTSQLPQGGDTPLVGWWVRDAGGHQGAVEEGFGPLVLPPLPVHTAEGGQQVGLQTRLAGQLFSHHLLPAHQQ